jgi:hypothetical protein
MFSGRGSSHPGTPRRVVLGYDAPEVTAEPLQLLGWSSVGLT